MIWGVKPRALQKGEGGVFNILFASIWCPFPMSSPLSRYPSLFLPFRPSSSERLLFLNVMMPTPKTPDMQPKLSLYPTSSNHKNINSSSAQSPSQHPLRTFIDRLYPSKSPNTFPYRNERRSLHIRSKILSLYTLLTVSCYCKDEWKDGNQAYNTACLEYSFEHCSKIPRTYLVSPFRSWRCMEGETMRGNI